MITPDEVAASVLMELGIGSDEVSRRAVVIELRGGMIRATASEGSKAEAVRLYAEGIYAMRHGQPWAAG